MTIENIERYINDKAFGNGLAPGYDRRAPDGQTGRLSAQVRQAGVRRRADPQRREGGGLDRHPEIGGLLTFGIPAFKLKRGDDRRREIFTGMGIEFKLNVEVGRTLQLDDLLKDYDGIPWRRHRISLRRAGNEDADGADAQPFLIANTKQIMGFGETSDEPYVSMEAKARGGAGRRRYRNGLRTYLHSSVQRT